MSGGVHSYSAAVRWTGNRGEGTSGYGAYERSHEISAPDRPPIPGSSDVAFRGDGTRYNPEDLLVSSLAACHLLSYLHLCADAGIVVTGYVDQASGTMMESRESGGHFTEVVLRPTVQYAPGTDTDLAMQLHERAHHLCFIANSVNFPVRCEARMQVESSGTDAERSS